MAHLPVSCAIVVAGGRNDELCKEMGTPFFHDIHLFLLDQKCWLRVKYSYDSYRLSHMSNASMCVITDSLQYEKIVIFGGIHNTVNDKIQSFLSNKYFLVSVKQRHFQGGFRQNKSQNRKFTY